MKRYIKSYLIFTSFIYRIVMFIVLPIMLIAVLAFGGYMWSHWNSWLKETIYHANPWISESVAYLSMIIIPFLEILSDNWLFCGIQSKHAEKMDYLKTSSVGMPVLRKALRMDLIRRFVSSMVITFAAYVVLAFNDKTQVHNIASDLSILLIGCLAAYFLSMLGIVISRYGNMLWINLLVTYLMLILSIMGVHILMDISGSCFDNGASVYMAGADILSQDGRAMMFILLTVFLLFLLIIADVAVSMLAVKKAMKKTEESYYD
ncbi:MAG: hypothetical protein NC313_14705 [Butyrivibrio sp.]|nr:hypothetical protein [Butyrivibrio sp.]